MPSRVCMLRTCWRACPKQADARCNPNLHDSMVCSCCRRALRLILFASWPRTLSANTPSTPVLNGVCNHTLWLAGRFSDSFTHFAGADLLRRLKPRPDDVASRQVPPLSQQHRPSEVSHDVACPPAVWMRRTERTGRKRAITLPYPIPKGVATSKSSVSVQVRHCRAVGSFTVATRHPMGSSSAAGEDRVQHASLLFRADTRRGVAKHARINRLRTQETCYK